jgi:hypothetical protein
MIIDIQSVKTLGVLWICWWVGIILILFRDDKNAIISDVHRFIKRGGLWGFVSTIMVLFIVPLSIPFSILYLINKWTKKP